MDDRLVFISDTHIGRNRYFGREKIVEAFQIAIDDAATTDNMLLIHCGDLFDSSALRSADLDAFAEVYEYLGEKDVQMHVVGGNHGRDSSGSSVVHHYGKVADERVVLHLDKISSWKHGTTVITFLPYGVSYEEQPHSGQQHILVGHGDIHGASYNQDMLSTSGMTLGELRAIIGCYDAVAFGHIHMPQKLLNLDNAVIVGAPLQFNFNSCGQSRGYAVLDLDSMVFEHCWIEGGPVFIKANKICDAPEGAFVRIVLPRDTDVHESNVREAMLAKGANEEHLSVSVESEEVKAMKRSDITASDSMKAMAVKYLDYLGMKGVQRAHLMRTHDIILDKAKDVNG